MNERFDRLIKLVNDDFNVLEKTRVIIFGIGGVGGEVMNLLARDGIGNIDIVDGDTVDVSNINRQFVAFGSTIGKSKVDVAKAMLEDINDKIKVNTFNFRYSSETEGLIDLKNYDYVVDCIDDIEAKKLLIKRCKELGVNIICACGAGGRFYGTPSFVVSDINKTSYDKIAKILRKFCHEEGIKKLDVCYTTMPGDKKTNGVIGSSAHFVTAMSVQIASKVVNKILEKKDEDK